MHSFTFKNIESSIISEFSVYCQLKFLFICSVSIILNQRTAMVKIWFVFGLVNMVRLMISTEAKPEIYGTKEKNRRIFDGLLLPILKLK